jgi:HSP20 family protein
MNYIKIKFIDKNINPENKVVLTMEEILRTAPGFSFSKRKWQPHLDIYETNQFIIIIAEIAGIRDEGIDLEITQRSIKISGYREIRLDKNDASYHLAEISFGFFERTISLPGPVDTLTADTSYKNGFLEIRLKKRSPNAVRKISIQSN